MNIETIRAFVKEAGLLQNVGMRIAKKSALAARFARFQATGAVRNAGKAVSAFSTPVKSLKAGAEAAFKPGMSTAQKAMLGVGALGSVAEVAPSEDPLHQGRSRFERATTAVGDQLGGLIGTPFGFTGGLVGSQIGRKAGMLAGKGAEGASRLLKRKKKEEPSSPSP